MPLRDSDNTRVIRQLRQHIHNCSVNPNSQDVESFLRDYIKHTIQTLPREEAHHVIVETMSLIPYDMEVDYSSSNQTDDLIVRLYRFLTTIGFQYVDDVPLIPNDFSRQVFGSANSVRFIITPTLLGSDTDQSFPHWEVFAVPVAGREQGSKILLYELNRNHFTNFPMYSPNVTPFDQFNSLLPPNKVFNNDVVALKSFEFSRAIDTSRLWTSKDLFIGAMEKKLHWDRVELKPVPLTPIVTNENVPVIEDSGHYDTTPIDQHDAETVEVEDDEGRHVRKEPLFDWSRLRPKKRSAVKDMEDALRDTMAKDHSSEDDEDIMPVDPVSWEDIQHDDVPEDAKSESADSIHDAVEHSSVDDNDIDNVAAPANDDHGHDHVNDIVTTIGDECSYDDDMEQHDNSVDGGADTDDSAEIDVIDDGATDDVDSLIDDDDDSTGFFDNDTDTGLIVDELNDSVQHNNGDSGDEENVDDEDILPVNDEESENFLADLYSTGDPLGTFDEENEADKRSDVMKDIFTFDDESEHHVDSPKDMLSEESDGADNPDTTGEGHIVNEADDFDAVMHDILTDDDE